MFSLDLTGFLYRWIIDTQPFWIVKIDCSWSFTLDMLHLYKYSESEFESKLYPRKMNSFLIADYHDKVRVIIMIKQYYYNINLEHFRVIWSIIWPCSVVITVTRPMCHFVDIPQNGLAMIISIGLSLETMSRDATEIKYLSQLGLL